MSRQERNGSVVNLTANVTLTAADSGNIYRVNAVDLVATLPATAEGLEYTFVVDTVSATTGFSVSPAAADNVNGGADDKDLINTAATDVKGDSVRVVGDGGEGWLTVGMHGIWAAEA
jgi:hypothetical protein